MCFDISGGKTTALTLLGSKRKQDKQSSCFPSFIHLCYSFFALWWPHWVSIYGATMLTFFGGGERRACFHQRWASSAHSLGFYSRLCESFHFRILEQLYCISTVFAFIHIHQHSCFSLHESPYFLTPFIYFSVMHIWFFFRSYCE